jgi:hypothetical protein
MSEQDGVIEKPGRVFSGALAIARSWRVWALEASWTARQYRLVHSLTMPSQALLIDTTLGSDGG